MTDIKTHQDRLEWLAGLEMDCPNSWHHWMASNPENVHIRQDNCPTCGDTGKVPRFPMLRQKCQGRG